MPKTSFSPLAAAANIPPLIRPQRLTPQEEVRPVRWLRLVFVGSAGCGKSSLIKRHCEHGFVPNGRYTTIGIDYGTRSVDEYFDSPQYDYRAAFLDTSGDPLYCDIAAPFYSEPNSGVVLVASATEPSSLASVPRWASQLNAAQRGAGAQTSPIIAFALTKTDERWAVSKDDAEAVAKRCNVPLFIVSASSGEGVEQLFSFLYKKTAEMVYRD